MDSLSDKAIGQWLKKRWAWLFAHKTWKQRQEKGWWTQLWAYNATRAAVYVLSLVVFVFVVWLLAKVSLEAWHSYETHKDTNLESFRNLMLGLGALVIGPLGFGLAVIRTVSTWKQARVADQKLQTETFATAIDQLNSEFLSGRLGAIYALEGLAKNSPQLHDSIFEALCAYVRDRMPLRKYDDNEVVQNEPLPADIQTILTIIGRRNRDYETSPIIINLNATHLRNANLYGGNFEGADLSSVRLEHADLDGASFKGALLFGTHLEFAGLMNTDFQYANLAFVFSNTMTNVQDADFRQAVNIPQAFRKTVAYSKSAQWPADDDKRAWSKLR